VAGRLARGAKEARSDSGGSSDTAVTPTPATTAPGLGSTGTAAADPLAGTGDPAGAAVYPEGSDANSEAWGNPTGSAT
jgi:hypothetical protein